MVRVGFGISVILFFLISLSSGRDTFIQANSTAFINGDYSAGFETSLSERFSLNTGLRYKDGQAGLSFLIYPINVERMFDATVIAGLRWYPYKSAKGLFGSADIEGGYSYTKVEYVSEAALDSTMADGFLLAPRVSMGYKWIFRNNLSIAPEIGASYEFNGSDFDNLSESDAVRERDIAFTVNKKYLKSYHNGLRPFVLINLGFRL